LDELVGDLAAAPVGDRSPRPLGGLARQGDDPADLLGGDPRRPAGPRGIGQAVLQAQLAEGDRLEGHPPCPPEPDGIEGHAERPGDLGVTLALSGAQDDPGSLGDLLGGGMPTQEGLEGITLLVGQFDGEGLGSAHGGIQRVSLG
jgi:hypothetical protein